MRPSTREIANQVDVWRAEQGLHERARELVLAPAMPQSRLSRSPAALTGFDIAGASHPARLLGRDYFEFIPMPDGALGLAVGDASGHGITAALLMAETRAYLRAEALTRKNVGAVLNCVNRHVAQDVAAGDFVTLLLARLDPRTRSLVYGSGGQWPGYLLDRRGKVRRTLRSTGLPLGIDVTAAIPSSGVMKLEPGDLLLLLTDGIAEAFSPDGSLFGMKRALDCVRTHRHGPAAEIVARLCAEAQAFSENGQVDDMTAVVVKVAYPSQT